MNAVATIPAEEISPDLSEAEQLFLYNLEVLGLPVARAAEMAGVKSPYYVLKRPSIVVARERYREALRGRTDFSREDVIAGFKHAIDQASVLGDPMAQIAGWREIAKMQGYDKQISVHMTLTGTIEQATKQVKSLSTEQLLEMVGQGGGNVLDGDFYRVREKEPDGRTD